MSAIALFIKVPVFAIDGLREAAIVKKRMFAPAKDTYWQYLREYGSDAAHYNWSGYAFNPLLIYLEEKRKIDLNQSEYNELAEFLSKARRCSHAVLTRAHRQAYLTRLAPAQYSEEELRRYADEFTGRPDPEAGKALLDGVAALHQSLRQLEEGFIVLFIIG